MFLPVNAGLALASQETARQEATTGMSTGVDLLNQCEAASRVVGKAPNLTTNDLVGAASCLGYLHGFNEASIMIQILYRGRFHAFAASDAYFCFPSDGASGEQMAMIVVKSLRDHPERLNELRPGLVFDALRQAFPCK